MFAFLPRALPASLSALTELALDLRWTWSHALDALWQAIDPELWGRTGNPWIILQNVSQHRLDELCGDRDFSSKLAAAIDDHRRYHGDRGWWQAQSEGAADAPGTIAYFSMEFGLGEAFALYAGGLGVLAGDYLKTASDLGVPVIGVGLLFQEGYFRQSIDASGRQREAYPYNDPTSLPIQPVIGADGAWLKVGLDLPGRTLYLRVWLAIVGRTRLYLLDSNDLRNSVGDRGITAKLYAGGAETRLLQEMVLGVGGCAMLDALGLEVDVCHMNEGHAALLVLERARLFMQKHGTSFRDAWWATRGGNVFTTHTPVMAGFDTFAQPLVLEYLRGYERAFDISSRDLLALGRADPLNDDEPFGMAYLALRGSAQANGVSLLHGEVSRRKFSSLYPRWPVDEVPVSHVTNGVHVPSWDSAWADDLWTCACGKGRWLGSVDGHTAAVAACDDEQLWALAAQQRRDLVRYARRRLGWQLAQRGEPQRQVVQAAQVLDPNILTLGFAHRFTDYKRPNLLLHDAGRLARLLTDERQPVQLIVAGKAHPDDERGKQLIHAWVEFSHQPALRRRVVFLEDYDMALAQQLVQGVDVWINTPRRPWEACGTSGMKVLANGGLNLSELDGWWAEAYRPAYGWAFGCGDDDADDAQAVYRILENDIVPAFYRRDARGVPREWVQRMRASMSELAPRFSSNRMLTDYLVRFYRPAAAAYRNRSRDQANLAKALNAWETALDADWHEVHFGPVEVRREQDMWRFTLPVYLGEILPQWVRVELYAEADGARPAECRPMTATGTIPGSIQGYLFGASVPATRSADHYTPRVRAWHDDAFLPAELNLIAWHH
ncbi:alpha-glucan phosphorylases family protein [Burkholderia thailandensis USAMRU Malaysia |uniref:Glycogen phosphorylase family protein n=1 Tax=Burkholderia thailandensis (strain ATCC 700388 / DSM 13276 / CCUG 48851 / CIP 106301 / E264) TaxID=271848 RepID=Q2T6R1_BURTA|nr:alpha-glucan family phosphorylase [Burkholderia thailandensis]ABC34360.1 glycogen phosphorylase family protein [Burkholderia thailandensis E264]AHI76874.1 alpha-glucan phosphorylases family protein [Burkholderia thailandensis 2002721723]AHI82101.1 alpha-glucan phosphorylases family protein [Burkholderia thailandensis E444]AIC90972.1 alpha-glucan phosphorylases family protein [Burkholderia thailandensis USAMRU Malaysia \